MTFFKLRVPRVLSGTLFHDNDELLVVLNNLTHIVLYESHDFKWEEHHI